MQISSRFTLAVHILTCIDTFKDEYKDVINFILKQYDKQIDKIKETKKTEVEAVKDQIDAIEKQIDAVNKEKEARTNAIDAEIDALQKERDVREKYWNDQLDKLERENKERENNIKLQEKQQALALAQQQNVKIIKDGRFVYSQDETAIASAEQALGETQDQIAYEQQRQLIEDIRDSELNWYDERIQNLQNYKEQVTAYYENQVEQLNNQKDKLEEYQDYLNDYYEEQINALEEQKNAVNELFEQGVADQQAYWDKMMGQLDSFVKKWNSLVGSMTFPDISGSGISLGAKSTGDNSVKIHAYASGKGSVGDSEIAVVGENPKYKELVIGSKINNDNGVIMNLKRGSGVVNAGATNTLASIFNALNGQNTKAQTVSNNSNATNITIGSISLPQVKDGKGFVDYLQNFSNDITQMSFARA